MTTTVNCDTCDHRIVCQFAAEANELKKRIRDDLPPPFKVTISCPHYSQQYDKYRGSISGTLNHVDAIPTATLQEG